MSEMVKKRRRISRLLDHSKDIVSSELAETPFRRARREFPVKKLTERMNLSEERINHLLFKDPARTEEQKKAIDEFLEESNNLRKVDFDRIRAALQAESVKELGSWSKTKKDIIRMAAKKKGREDVFRLIDKVEEAKVERNETNRKVNEAFEKLGLSEKVGTKSLAELNTQVMLGDFDPQVKVRLLKKLRELDSKSP